MAACGGDPPRISDAELVTLCVMQALLSFTSEARWLRYARTHLRHLFPYLPLQPGYNKRLRKLADRSAARRNGRCLLLVIGALALLTGAVRAVVGGLRDHGHSTGHGQHSPWFLLLLVTLVFVVPVVAGGAALVWMMRRPSYQRVMQYGWSERRRTVKAIKAGRPLDQRQLRIARASLDYAERQRWFLWLFPVLIVLWFLSGLRHSDDLFGKLEIGLAVLYLLVCRSGSGSGAALLTEPGTPSTVPNRLDRRRAAHDPADHPAGVPPLLFKRAFSRRSTRAVKTNQRARNDQNPTENCHAPSRPTARPTARPAKHPATTRSAHQYRWKIFRRCGVPG